MSVELLTDSIMDEFLRCWQTDDEMVSLGELRDRIRSLLATEPASAASDSAPAENDIAGTAGVPAAIVGVGFPASPTKFQNYLSLDPSAN
jgi:hypothetical protein